MDGFLEFVSALRKKGVILWAAGGNLHYKDLRGTLTPTERATLKAFKSQLVDFLLQTRPPEIQMDLTPFSGIAPLTFQQQEWIRGMQHGQIDNRLDPFVLHLEGAIDHESFRQALVRLVARHGALRTRIETIDAVPVQRVTPASDFALPIERLTYVDSISVRSEATRIAESLSNIGCDLSRDPLFDVRLVQLGAQEHLLVWAIHHLISDGSSIDLMFREFWHLYADLKSGVTPDLDPDPPQYASYALWQQQSYPMLLKQNGEYWRERLAGASGIKWPRSDRVFADKSLFLGLEVSFDKASSDQLRIKAREFGVPLSTLMLSFYAMTLFECCDQSRLLIAVASNGRDRRGEERIIGYLAHSVYLRLQFVQTERLQDFVASVQRELSQAILHSDFGQLAAQRPELFSGTVFQWMPWAPGTIDGMPTASDASKLGINVRVFPFERRDHAFCIFDLLTVFTDTGECVKGFISYDETSFSRTMDWFASALRQKVERELN